MAANNANPMLDDGPAKTSPAPNAQTVAGEAERTFADAAELAKQSITDVAAKAQRAVHETIETLRAQSRTYVDSAGQQFDVAQKYVVDRVKERPVTATMAGVGVGLLLGLLLASRSRHSS